MRPVCIAITGATSGIGAALAREYADVGVRLLLLGRDPTRMAQIEADATGKGAEAMCVCIDLRDTEAIVRMLQDFAATHPIDLLILAAGVKVANCQGVEHSDGLDRVVDVNLRATMQAAQAVLPAMLARGIGQIAVFSSAAALAPTADLLSYSATKAGLRAYGTALRRSLLGTGVKVNVITPGFVDTPMTDRQDGPTPMKISATQAASTIRRGLARNRPQISFPRPLMAVIWIANLLPTAWGDRIFSGFRARILPDGDAKTPKADVPARRTERPE